ncbi:putative ATPase/DNA-binding winged helix-turn-helix (wHTH) protein [Paraburkholderia sp. GAS199]|uniref:ATP-binding protein n=1 Tax=Paraburkholderia sp. GAS199 TaxID=3035126 RepID=UPI003D213825
MIKIGRIAVSLEMREVFLDGQPLPLGSRAFGILELLLQAGGKTVTKEEIFRHVWPNSVVGENNIHVQLSALRKIFDGQRQVIRTISGRGYRLTIETEPAETAATALPYISPSELSPFIDAGSLNGLPVCHTPLIGREDATADVVRALEHVPIVTLLGPGGIGKTQLGVAIARAIAEKSGVQVCFVALASVGRDQSIVGTLAQALGVSCNNGNVDLSAVIAAIQRRKLLIVLDNCEHVIESAAIVCDALLQASADLRILATSRELLRSRGENSYSVAALSTPSMNASSQAILACGSVKLFLSQLNALNAAPVVERASLDMIATVCRRLDGVPLAIELAAARAAVFGVRKLLSELDNRFQFLTGGRRTAPRRQQTLEASLEWGYELLDESEKFVLNRLAVFPAQFSLEAVCAVAASGRLTRNEVTEAIVGLASKSFIMTTCDSRTKEYFLLETIRDYALRKLHDSGDAEEVLSRNVDFTIFEEAGFRRSSGRTRLASPISAGALVPQ